MPWIQGQSLRGHPRLSRARKLWLALVLVLPTLGIGSVSPVLAAGQFTFLAAGFTQELYGVDPGFLAGVAFASNGDPLVAVCSAGSGGALQRYDRTTTLPTVHGTSTLHPESTLPSAAGCGLTNHPNGAIYTNTNDGVVKLDATTGGQLGGPFGARGGALGIATDPQTGNLVYVDYTGAIGFVNPGLTASGTFSTVTTGHLVDGIFFDPTGNFLFMSNRSPTFQLTIVRHDGSLVQNVAMSSEPDGIAFHSAGAPFVLTNNTDGTMTRFDFPGNDFTKAPTQSMFASGGFRGDLTQVGPDACLYLTQGRTRYDDGTFAYTNSLVRICPGFEAPPGVNQCTPTGNLLGNPGFETAIASQPAFGNWIVKQSSPATVSQPKHPVHSGSASLGIDITQSSDFGYVYQEVSGFQPTNGWTFSAYFYAARGKAQQPENITVVNLDTTLSVNTAVTVSLPPVGGPALSTDTRFVADDAVPITQGQWHLISLLATTKQIQMTLDAGVPVSLPYTPPALTQGSVTIVTFGETAPGALSHFFFDDVALVQQCSGPVAPGVSFTASDKDWSVTGEVTPHEGMQVTNLATNRSARDLGATISMPYVVVTSSRRPGGQIYFLLRDGDEIDAQGRVYGHSKLVAGPNVVIRKDRPGGFELQATYLIVLDGPLVANRSQLTVLERIILVDQINDSDPGVVPCEPSETALVHRPTPFICDRFRPALSYTFFPAPGDQLLFVEAVQRLQFHPDGKPIAASTLAHDCNIGETISPSGDQCFNNPFGLAPKLPGIALFNRNEDPLTIEAAQVGVDTAPRADLGGGPGNFPGKEDNIHLSTHFLVSLPLPPPGCPNCIHLHWRWASDISGQKLGNGNPLVGCCDKLWPTADPSNDQLTCVLLVSSGGAIDGSFKKGKMHPGCDNPPVAPLTEPIVWYASRSGQTANTFFAWGGFVCPSPDGKVCTFFL
jgi:hypothetical protein